MDELRDAALRYAAEGFSVLPLRPNDKRPAIHEWKPLQKTPWTTREINEWWGEHPESNIGIITGEISGVSVIDLDGPHAPALLKAQGLSQPKTRTVKTPHGFHLYVTYDPRLPQTAGILQAGDECDCSKKCSIDTRSNGGYVVAPPSVVS
jgi:hypothetical protein